MPVAAALVVFLRILSHGWVEFDDPLNVTENPHLYPVSWDGIAALWRHAYGHLYVPVSYTLFAAEAVSARAIAGTGATALPPPWLFHACSLLLHVAAVVCVQRICGRFSRDVWAVSAGATLFAVHPLQVETVAWISEQRGLLAGVLGLVAILLFLRWERDEAGVAWRSPAYLLATAAFGAALLAKPVALTVPLIVAVLVRMRPARPWVANAAALVPWCVMALAAGWVARLVQPAELTALTTPPWLRTVVALDAVAFYLQRLVLPWNLCVAYGRTPQAVLDDPWSPLPTAATATLLVAVAVLPRCRLWRAPLALFLIPLVPVLGFVPFVYQNQSTVADRYAYLAMLGPALATTVVVAPVAAAHRAARLSIAVVLACLAGLSWRQAGVWKDTGTLAVQACVVAPNVTGSWTLRSAHHLARGEPDAAVACARRAVELVPTNRIALLNLASGLIRSGDAAAGAEVFRRLAALGLGADEAATIFYNRGVTHLAAGDGVEAAADFGIACGLVPGHPAATASLRRVLAQLGVDPDAARAPEGPGSDAASPPVGPVPAGPGRHAGRGE